MKIAIGGDHAGFEFKKAIITTLKNLNINIHDFGPFTDASCDYPDHVHPLAFAIENEEYDLGILICGSGNGVSITANKHRGIRCALAWTPEIATLARLHNNVNIISIPARFVSEDVANKIVSEFINTKFEAGRHQCRVDKIPLKDPAKNSV